MIAATIPHVNSQDDPPALYRDTLLGRWSAIQASDICGYLVIPHEAIRQLGPAARTWAAVSDLCDKRTGQTYAATGRIAERAMLPDRTVKRHLRSLCEPGGPLTSLGRQKPPNGRQKRRTVTYQVGRSLFEARRAGRCARLPLWWGLLYEGRQTHSAALVYSVIVGKLATAAHVAVDQLGDDDPFFVDTHAPHFGEFTLDWLESETRMSRPTIADALVCLEMDGLIDRAVCHPQPTRISLSRPNELRDAIGRRWAA